MGDDSSQVEFNPPPMIQFDIHVYLVEFAELDPP